ncbi:MAG: sigma-70 family RNA polymerase sigma factor [Planctomycetes bacterium]|nr:sigma-70 family RNA polymerase sigma factor [Planctomycetota bacterium]
MVRTTSTYEIALDSAARFLARRRDQEGTCADDLAQIAAIETWQRADGVRNSTCVPSYARTIARRLRSQAIRAIRSERSRAASVADRIEDRAEVPLVRIEDRWHRMHAVLEVLDEALAAVGSLNACLVRGYYEGFSCRELAERYGLDDTVVKARLHRSRARLRALIVARLPAPDA